MWGSCIFRKYCKFWHSQPISSQKRCSKIQKIWHRIQALYVLINFTHIEKYICMVPIQKNVCLYTYWQIVMLRYQTLSSRQIWMLVCRHALHIWLLRNCNVGYFLITFLSDNTHYNQHESLTLFALP